MVLLRKVSSETLTICAFSAFQWKIWIVLFTSVITPKNHKDISYYHFKSKTLFFIAVFIVNNIEIYAYLQGGLHLLTLKSFLLGSQYIPHSSGRVGTNLKVLQGHSLQDVSSFFPKYLSLCPVR